MFFLKNLTVPAGTPVSLAVRDKIEITGGWIKEIEIGFPPGCLGLVGVRVLRFEQQLVPLTPGEWLKWDDTMVKIPLDFPIDSEPFELNIDAYNEDDTYAHTIQIGVHVMEETEGSLLRRLLEAGFGKLRGKK